jgi:hypothetical protein
MMLIILGYQHNPDVLQNRGLVWQPVKQLSKQGMLMYMYIKGAPSICVRDDHTKVIDQPECIFPLLPQIIIIPKLQRDVQRTIPRTFQAS